MQRARKKFIGFMLRPQASIIPGIVHRLSKFLADRGINIINVRTQRTLSAESGTPLFEMDIEIDVPQSISEQRVREEFHHLANELMIDLVLRRR